MPPNRLLRIFGAALIAAVVTVGLGVWAAHRMPGGATPPVAVIMLAPLLAVVLLFWLRTGRGGGDDGPR